MKKKKLGAKRFWQEQSDWSRKIFGEDNVRNCIGPFKHLRKEIDEVIKELEQLHLGHPITRAQEKKILEELVDCQFLVYDSARRLPSTYEQFVRACFEKLEINKKRKWGPQSLTEPTEHIRDEPTNS